MKRSWIYIGVFVLLIVILFIIESSIPKPIDWTPTFNEIHKKQWGTYVLHSELENLFPESDIEDALNTPYEKLKDEGRCYNTTYIFIDEIVDFDFESIEELLDFVDDGNKLFISAEHISTDLLDKLDINIDVQFSYNLNNDTLKKPLYFTNEKLTNKYEYDLGFSRSYFSAFDTSKTVILGLHSFDNEEYINFIKVSYGDGFIFLHTQPYAFTNYHMLKNNHADYVSGVFAYIDNKNIFWDGKRQEGLDEQQSTLRYIMSEPSLRFAWRLGLAGLLLFIFFMARRRQRIVPVIKKLPNSSIEFAKTIGDLYYREGETKDIVNNKIAFFLEKLRTTYFIDTSNLNEDFKKRLHQKSGVDQAEIDKLVHYIVFLSKKDKIDELFLITLNRLIDNFNRKAL